MHSGDVTKRALSMSLKENMRTKELDKLTVTEITDTAGVSRNTFYYHFSDINQLLEWTYDNEVVTGLESFRTQHDWQEGLLRVLDYTEANKRFCLNTFHSLSRDRLEQFLYRITYGMLLAILNEHNQANTLSETVKEQVADFYGRAIVSQVIHWLVTNLKEPKQELVSRIAMMTDGTIEMIVAHHNG